MIINIHIDENKFWKKHIINKYVIIWLKGYIYSHTIEQIKQNIQKLSKEDILNFVQSLDGHFSLVVRKNEFTFISVDKIRSTPLFFTKIDDKFYIDYDPKNLVLKKDFQKDIIPDSILEISMSGYTIGNKTIYNNLHSLKAGEIVVFSDDNFKYIQYYKYFGDIVHKNYDDYIDELSEVTLNIFRKMLNHIGDRQIIVPLSAGNDSRLVISALKHLGVKNVKCYSYGTIGNFEAGIAEVIAKKLGYEWIFIPLTHKSEKQFYSSKEYQEFLEFSETYCSVPYIQSLSTIKYLKEINFIEEDAIFINGNSGDFVSGAHINALMNGYTENITQDQRKENILNSLIEKHFSLWGYLKQEVKVNKIKILLWDEINIVCKDLSTKEKDHLFYEYSELIDRQSKYVITGQRAYEFYGHEWRLPLWDDEYLDFWQKIPAEFKINQKLYIDMLNKKNYGDVWGSDIPVNKKMISPRWIVPIRYLVKLPFGLFGKSGKKVWKQFDINFFYYWRDVTHMINTVSYTRVIKDFFNKPAHHVSWHTEDYLEDKK